jgi:hypothetical protein
MHWAVVVHHLWYMNLRWCSLALEDEFSHRWSAYSDGGL